MDKITELKARAYDLIALIEFSQKELNKVNQELLEASRSTPPKVESSEE